LEINIIFLIIKFLQIKKVKNISYTLKIKNISLTNEFPFKNNVIPDFSLWIEIHRSKVNPCKAKTKYFFCFFLLAIFYFLGKINILKHHIYFTRLIKGIILRQGLWGANTFPTRNQLRNSNPVSQTFPYLWFFHIFQ